VDFASIDRLRQHHPAWRLLNSSHAALVVSFLHRVFVMPNRRLAQLRGFAGLKTPTH
jgi:hypothetical protein